MDGLGSLRDERFGRWGCDKRRGFLFVFKLNELFIWRRGCGGYRHPRANGTWRKHFVGGHSGGVRRPVCAARISGQG